ncbi:elongation factor P 5-aminopentanone reductase [Ruminococcus albus]|uniref:3-oxoacyl-[acyl-carrier protein] reductase n=1 Tax=Ruminococcus albus TaxID=1264 RepID=A0A1I1GDI8_RUMAL|nr:3-oxoacyl-ACP reductase FabG [Ruminococcus albus]SFC09857.1 3-oxoacyl-[acyl-carrier protein] reductase [Ruminococcus albus]
MGRIKKAAIVTGGSGGIGGAISRKLAQAGYLTAIGYNKGKEEAEVLAAELRESGFTAEAFRCDIADPVSWAEFLTEVEKSFGECELLVNNAGIADIGLFTDLTDERLYEIMNTDLLGHMRLTKAVLPQMIRRHSGSVINISSVWGESGASCEVAYSAAKAGLIGFTKALARECAPSGVRVNCVSCGLIDTKMNSTLSAEDLNAVTDEIPMGRMGTPDDIANAVMFLAEESSAYITGQVLRVDGGWL